MTTPDETPPDREIAALLDFTPVHRHTRRSDGWPPERQQGFVAALATLGNVDRAAHRFGRTASGAYKVRTSAGAEGFADAWDKALALYHIRNPKPSRVGRPSRGELLTMPAAPHPEPPPDPQEQQRADKEVFERIVVKYFRKLGSERRARLEGRIAEADFCVRQLTSIEIILDLGGKAHDLLGRLRRRDLGPLQIAATPMSVFLDKVRRECWAEKGEPERPPLGELGAHDGEVSTGPPTYYGTIATASTSPGSSAKRQKPPSPPKPRPRGRKRPMPMRRRGGSGWRGRKAANRSAAFS